MKFGGFDVTEHGCLQTYLDLKISWVEYIPFNGISKTVTFQFYNIKSR